MNSKFISNLSFILAVNLIVKPLWMFGIDRSVQNRVGAEMYGSYIAMYSLSLIFSFILDMGIANFNTRFLAQNARMLQKYFKYFLSMKIFLALIYVVLSLLLAWLLNYHSGQLKLLVLLLLNQVFLSHIIFFRSIAAGMHYFKADALISVTDRLLIILVCTILLWGIPGLHFQIEWFIYTQTAVYLITTLFAGWFVKRFDTPFRLLFRGSFFLALIKKTWPYALLALLMTVYNRSDMVLLERMLPDGARQSGIFAQAYRILEAFSMVALLFAGILMPMFTRMIHRKQAIGALVKLSAGLIMFGALLTSVVSFFYATELMNLLYTSHQEHSVRVFQLLMPASLGIAASYVFGTLLTANGNIKQLNVMAFGGVLFSICANVLIIPHFRVEGAAFVTLLTQWLTGAAQVYLSVKLLRLRISFSLLLRIAAFVLLVLGVAYAVSISDVYWVHGVALIVMLSFTMLFVTRLIRFRALRNFGNEIMIYQQTSSNK